VDVYLLFEIRIETLDLSLRASRPPQQDCHRPAWPGDPVSRDGRVQSRSRGVLDRPVKPGEDSGVCLKRFDEVWWICGSSPRM